MFRHKGKTRTLEHNLKIASLLSGVAGVVNVAGFFAIQKLTTNVTGHFAFFIDEVFKQNFHQSVQYLLYVVCFFLGSFFSSLCIEFIRKINERYIYQIPVLIESLILLSVSFVPAIWISNFPNIVSYSLLFAMGLQNSLVTSISNATVRTTHLTGLFTDMGIELSQLFFYKQKEQKTKLHASIRLRLTIISCFFLGGILGASIYSLVQLKVLAMAALILVVGLIYDDIKLHIRINKH